MMAGEACAFDPAPFRPSRFLGWSRLGRTDLAPGACPWCDPDIQAPPDGIGRFACPGWRYDENFARSWRSAALLV